MSTETNRVVTELIFESDIRGAASYTRAIKEAQVQTDKLSDTEEKARLKREGQTASFMGVSSSIARVRAEYTRLQGTTDPIFAKQVQQQKELERAILVTDAAVRRGVASEQQAAATVARLRAQQVVDLNRVREATEHLAAAQRAQGSAANDNFRRRNLQFQLFDVGTGLAGGMNPALIAMQQGPQILQQYAGAGGINAALKDTMGLLGGIARGFGPIALAAGVGALAIAGLTEHIQETTGVAVTFGDTFKAILEVTGRAIYSVLQPAIDAIAPWFADAWDLVKQGTAAVVNFLGRGFDTAVAAIKLAAKAIGPALIVAGEEAANGFIEAINWMVRKAVEGFNFIIDGANRLVDMVGGDWLRENLGWDTAIEKLDPNKWGFDPFDWGGKEKVAAIKAEVDAFGKTMQDLAGHDYAAAILKAFTDETVLNAKERLAETAKETKGVGEAARQATDPWKGLRDVTVDATESLHDFTEEAAQAGQQLKDTLGNVLQDLFSGPIKDADEFFSIVMSGFADLGRQNLGKFMDLFGGQGSGIVQGVPNTGAAWDGGWREVGSMLKPDMMKGVQQGSFAGVRDGLVSAFKTMGMSGKVAGNVADGIGATVGAFAMGYEQQSPLMGGLSGAMSGAAAGTMIMPGIGTVVGAIVGGVAGALGGMFGQSDEEKRQKEEAKAALQSNTQAITALIQFSQGAQPGALQKSYLEQYDANRKLQTVAMAAGDKSLVRDLQEASNRTFSRLYDILISDFDDLNNALRAGFGRNSAVMEGKEAIRALSDQIQQWVGDVRYMTTESDRLGGGNIGAAGIEARVQEAKAAGQEMLLASLRGVEALSPVAQELQRIEGASKALKPALMDLGMTADQATAAIAEAADEARRKLDANFIAGVDARFYAANGQDYINDLRKLAEATKTELENSAARGGLGMDRIRETFRLSAQSIVTDASLSSNQVAEATRILSEALAAIGETIPQAVQEVIAKAAFDRAGIQSRLNSARGQDYLTQFGDLRTYIGDQLGSATTMEQAGLVRQYQDAAAQSIARNANLSTAALRQLAGQFPDFAASIISVADDMDRAAEAAARAERNAAAAAAAAARREASLGLQSGLLSRTQGAGAAQDYELSRLAVGNVSLSGIRNAGSIDEARRQLDIFITTIRRTAQGAADLTAAGQLAYAVFDETAQRLDQVASGFDSMFTRIEDAQTAAIDRITSSYQGLQDELRSTFDRGLDELRRQRADFFDAASGANSYLNSIATMGTNPQTAYETLLGRFRGAAANAATGNPDALRGLTGQADSLLQAAAAFFPAGTSQYDAVLNEVRGAIGTGAGAATDRGNEVSARIVDLNRTFTADFGKLTAAMEKATAQAKEDSAKVLEELKKLQAAGQASAFLLDQLTKLVASGKPEGEILKAVERLIADTRANDDQLAAIAKKKAA